MTTNQLNPSLSILRNISPKIADLKAHNASQCEALCACRLAIFWLRDLVQGEKEQIMFQVLKV